MLLVLWSLKYTSCSLERCSAKKQKTKRSSLETTEKINIICVSSNGFSLQNLWVFSWNSIRTNVECGMSFLSGSAVQLPLKCSLKPWEKKNPNKSSRVENCLLSCVFSTFFILTPRMYCLNPGYQKSVPPCFPLDLTLYWTYFILLLL